jgi:hypothetical protein
LVAPSLKMADDIEAELAAAGKELDKVSQVYTLIYLLISSYSRTKRLKVRYYYLYICCSIP